MWHWILPITFTIISFTETWINVEGFAYAPNFIVKIISENTGRDPVGLLDVGNLNDSQNESDPMGSKSTGRFHGPITTRFPPEPNGYLHLGHAKAVSFNFAVARMFPPDGRCHMRLDDTNPSKEDQEYVDSILEDVRWIQSGCPAFEDAPLQSPSDKGPWYGPVRKTSDYFQLIYDCAVSLIKSGDAYVCSLNAEEIREYRGTLTEPGKESPYRTRSVEENLSLFTKMREGMFKDGEHVLRAKIDMSSPNINMRDPVLFRIKHESHPATGDAWCIYPMYDFSHPIADAIEEISHSLCTLEFEDHRPFYDWTLDKLLPTGLLKARPQQIEFSRLNVKYNILSKRKLIQLIEGKYVNGWDDPRMPTLSGMRRRGIPPEALRLFCERVGISKSESFIDLTDLENCVREVMDERCPRAFAILNPLKVTITNWEDTRVETFSAPRHPKLEELGDRIVPFGANVFIERSDFFDLDGPEGETSNRKLPDGYKRLSQNQMVRLKYAYVIQCDEVVRDPNTQEPLELKCSYYPSTRSGVTPKDMKRVSGIIQWVEASSARKCTVNQYDRLFKAEEPGRESGNFLDDLNPGSHIVLNNAIVEPSVAVEVNNMMLRIENSQHNDNTSGRIYHSELSYQFERNGYFALDVSSSPSNLVFNRVVTLKDTWGELLKEKETEVSVDQLHGSKKSDSDGGMIEDVRRVAFRASKIVDVQSHPEAENLIVCQVECGDHDDKARVIVASLAGKVARDDLVGRKVVCVTNIKPSKMRGVESNGVLLVASNGGKGSDEFVEPLYVPDDVPVGELFSFEGKVPSNPDPMMKSKGAIKAFERVKASLQTNNKGEVAFVEGGLIYRLTSSAGPITTKTLVNAAVQ